MKQYTFLVTGCGGDISQSMGKILREYSLASRVIGCDIHNEHAGHFIFHECFVVERADSPGYIYSIASLIQEHKVDIIIPVTEYELEYMVMNGQKEISKCLVVRPNDLSIKIGLDKFLTAKYLEDKGLPFPETVLLDGAEPVSLPCIVKSRQGSGSKSLYFVEDQLMFELVSKLVKDAICQEYLGTTNDEFTCGVFRSKSKETRTIIFRRKLTGGFTSFGIVERNEIIEDLLLKLAASLNLIGSINVQLRLHNNVPVIFEINARFSSTVLFRHMFGFTDLIWSIEDEVGLPLKPYTAPPVGSKFYKGFQEYIVKSII